MNGLSVELIRGVICRERVKTYIYKVAAYDFANNLKTMRIILNTYLCEWEYIASSFADFEFGEKLVF